MRNALMILLFFGLSLSLNAQRFAYVDTDYILQNLSQYNQAQRTLQSQTQQWNQEIQNRQEALAKKQADFLNEKVLLTDEQIAKEQSEIDEEYKAIQELQEQRYGQDGDLVRLRRSLVKPIQDQVWIAIKQVAEKRNYSFIFDKGSDLIMVYTDPKFDISREVLLTLDPNALDGKGSTNNASQSRGNNTSKPGGNVQGRNNSNNKPNTPSNRSNTNQRGSNATGSKSLQKR